MFIDECKWIFQALSRIPPDQRYPILDIGSSTLAYRTKKAPFIESELFSPLRQEGAICHFDIKNARGVDLVGDFFDPVTFNALKAVGARTILCNSFLAHVADPILACQNLMGLVRSGGYLCVSSPEIYPFCSDPWDNGFRPNEHVLRSHFLELEVVESLGLSVERSYYSTLRHDRSAAIALVLRLLVPFWKPANWLRAAAYLPLFFRRYKVSCLLLQRSTVIPSK